MVGAIRKVLVVALLLGCRREATPRGDPAEVGPKEPTAAELLTTLLDLYGKMTITKASDVPAPDDRWNGHVIRIAGLATIGPVDDAQPRAIRVTDKPGRTLAVRCLVADQDAGLPNDGETVTVEGRLEVSAIHYWQLPLAYWAPILVLRDCRRVP